MLKPPSSAYDHPTLLFYMQQHAKPAPNAEPAETGLGPSLSALVEKANAYYAAHQPLLEAIHLRQQQQLDVLQSAGWHTFRFSGRIAWRLAAGLSQGRIWNSSLLLHPLYGYPYLSGSGLKGSLRAWDRETGNPDKDLWGTSDQEGGLLLLEAFPLAKATRLLRLDVLTKHHPGYYENDASATKPADRIQPPADWDSPEPVQFVTFSPGVRIAFRGAVRQASSLAPFVQLLKDALSLQGTGAKTRKGYGRIVDLKEL